ncbi:MAG: hypothetical protein AAFW98_16505 [Pseudomonadota bacterium]
MGRTIAKLAAALRAHILASDIDAAALEILTGIATQTLDAADAPAIAALFESEGAFDGVANTAVWVHHGTILDVDQAAWKPSFAIVVDSI